MISCAQIFRSMKPTPTSFYFLIGFVSIAASGLAQMIPITTTLKTPYGNVPHTQYVGPMNYYYGQQNISARFEFTVVLKNDSSFKTKTRINLKDGEDNSITVKQDGTKEQIFPNDTKYISRITVQGKVLKGIPADSCWLFKAMDGEINGYGFLAEELDTYIIAIQDGDDCPIVPLTKDNLMPLVMSDQKCVGLVRKNKLRRALARYNYQVKLKQK